MHQKSGSLGLEHQTAEVGNRQSLIPGTMIFKTQGEVEGPPLVPHRFSLCLQAILTWRECSFHQAFAGIDCDSSLAVAGRNRPANTIFSAPGLWPIPEHRAAIPI